MVDDFRCISSISGDSGDAWHRGVVNVNPRAEFYFIIEGLQLREDHFTLNFTFLQGIYRGSYLGDMAIDDVLVTPNAQCEIPTTTTTTPSTTTLGQFTPLSCNFETDSCLWINDTSASGYWKRRQGSTSNISVGPHYGNI